ncbi:MarR family transcriptional regulator [Actinomadura sp. SCN-SB]|uniref:MarR family transcriptional regulator n=1 Tax=Actinomadura sp. SCN-SB TaxID=3373092 RepID=UPI0037516C33
MASEKTIANTLAENRSTCVDGAASGSVLGTGAGRPSGAAGDVWDALTANPGGTVAGIAAAAQVSRATVARVLTTLERDGRAVRTRGGRDGGKRRPDVWNAITPDTAPSSDDTTAATDTDTRNATTDAAPQDADRDTPDTDNASDAADAATTNGDTSGMNALGMDAGAIAEARDALTVLGAAISDALTALDGGDGAAALTAIETVYGGSGKARRLVRAAANGRPRTSSGRPRSLPGEMRAQVAAHLAAHPGAEFTPHEIGKVLVRSAGAVSNALDRLVEAGHAALVCERPRRFKATPTTDAAAHGARPVAHAAH